MAAQKTVFLIVADSLSCGMRVSVKISLQHSWRCSYFLISLHSVAGLTSHCQARRNSRVCYLNNCLRPWSRVFWKSLVPQLVKKFSTFCGSQRLINMFERAHYMFLSCDRSVQSTACRPISTRSVLVLYSHLCLGLANGLGYAPKPCMNLSSIHATCLTYLILRDLIT